MRRTIFFIGIVIVLVFISLFTFRFLPAHVVNPVSTRVGIFKPEVIGFQPYWLVGKGKDSYADTVTTLTVFGLAVASDGGILREEKPGELDPGYAILADEKYQKYLSEEKARGVKLSLLVQNMVKDDIETLIKEPEKNARTLVSAVAPLMRKVGFTDLNLDIEHFEKADEATRSGYTRFVKAVKEELDRGKLGTLTVELTPKSPIEQHLIDVAAVASIADFVVLMAYDYHYIGSYVAGAVAPIGGVPESAEYDVTTALRETLRYVPPQKLILGIPTYGYEWETLSDVPGSPVIGNSWQTTTPKRIVSEYLGKVEGEIRGRDAFAGSPYLIFKGETPGHFQQVFYEDKDSIAGKIGLAKEHNLAGVAFWAMGYENEDLLDPVLSYKNTVSFRGLPKQPEVPYTSVPFPQYELTAPERALKGEVVQSTGTVKKMGRKDEEYKDIDATKPILEGEALYIEEGSAFLRFPGFDITAVDGTELTFPELVAPNCVVRQKSGTAVYTLAGDTSLSIRVFGSLVTLLTGTMEVELGDLRATIRIVSGKALLGTIDDQNVTTTYELSEGTIVRLDGESKTIRIY
jgi:spore germination protein YaaH